MQYWYANNSALKKNIQWLHNPSSLNNHRLNKQKKIRTFLVCGFKFRDVYYN